MKFRNNKKISLIILCLSLGLAAGGYFYFFSMSLEGAPSQTGAKVSAFKQGTHYIKVKVDDESLSSVRFYFSLNSEAGKEIFVLLSASKFSPKVNYIHSVFSDEHYEYAKIYLTLEAFGLSKNTIAKYFTSAPFSKFKSEQVESLMKDNINTESFFTEVNSYLTAKKASELRGLVADDIEILPEIYVGDNLLILGSFDTFEDVMKCIEELITN